MSTARTHTKASAKPAAKISRAMKREIVAKARDIADQTKKVKELLKKAYALAKPISKKANGLMRSIDKVCSINDVRVHDFVSFTCWHDICDFEDLADSIKYSVNNCK